MSDHKEGPIGREEIEKRAFELCLQCGAEHGDDEQDWLSAEAQLTDERKRGREASESRKTKSAGQ
jgi:hypothetical protein